MRTGAIILVCAALMSAAPVVAADMSTPKAARPGVAASVYDGQPDFTEEELLRFARTLPMFRSWTRKQGEHPHPDFKNGKPDFVYSEACAEWARFHGWDEKRFFCIMGRSAAALNQVMNESGRTGKKRSRDMPIVSKQELDLVRLHLGELLKAADDNAPTPGTPAPG